MPINNPQWSSNHFPYCLLNLSHELEESYNYLQYPTWVHLVLYGFPSGVYVPNVVHIVCIGCCE